MFTKQINREDNIFNKTNNKNLTDFDFYKYYRTF